MTRRCAFRADPTHAFAKMFGAGLFGLTNETKRDERCRSTGHRCFDLNATRQKPDCP